MRKIVEFFIRYEVPVNIIIVGVIAFGILGMLNTKSSFFPLVPTNFISVGIVYPGASPAQIEEGIVSKMEEEMKGIVGIERITSRSYENAANISVELEKGVDANVALQEIKNAVDGVTALPGDMENPIVAKVENLVSTMGFTVSGDGVDLRTLKSIARQIESDLLKIEGISQVELSGYPEEEIEIAVRELDLRAYDLTFQDIAVAVANMNIITTGGTIKTKDENYTIRVSNRNYYADEIDHIVVKTTASGNVIRLKDIATVRDKFNESPDRISVNGNLAVFISVSNTNEEDLLVTAKDLKRYIKEFNHQNNNLQIEIIDDRAKVLNQRTNLLLKNGAIGILLVLIMLSIFLDFRLAFWVSLGMVFSLTGFFIFADYFGVTINVLSLFGLIMILGILVDDGIVIAENIYHHHELGKSRQEAAIDGMMEVLPAITSAIFTTIIAFTTFFFVAGRIGTFFTEVSLVVIITLTISLFEALIILPSHLAHSKAMSMGEGRKGWVINRWGDQLMKWLRDNIYAPAIHFILRAKLLGMAIFVGLAMITFGAFKGGVISFEFFPSIDSDEANVSLTMPQGTNETITDSIINYIESKVWETADEFEKQFPGMPAVRFVERRLGPGTNRASLNIYLLEGQDRKFSAPVFSNSLRAKVGPVYGVESLLFDARSNFGGSPIAISLGSRNEEELKGAVEFLKAKMGEDDRIADITDDDPEGVKEINVQLKPNAPLLGFTLGNVMQQVRGGFFGQQAQRLQRGRDDIRVWVRYDREDRSSIRDLDNMWLKSPTGNRVPFSEIADYSIKRGEVSINHSDGARVISVNANASSESINATEVLGEIKADLIPQVLASFPSISVNYEGQNRTADQTTSTLGPAALRSLVIILFVIALTFRTYTKQLLFLPIILLSMIGVGWGHNIMGLSVNVLSMLGIIALIGILVNDGLVLMAKLNTNIKQGMEYDDALFEACKTRFRPIFLTTVTTMAGLGPLMFETSRQAQFLIPMAASIVFGIAFATVLTLFLLPIMLSNHNRAKRFFTWLFTGKKMSGEKVERAYIEMGDEKYKFDHHEE